MIERNKKLIIYTTIYVIVVNLIAVIVAVAKKNNDLIPTFNVASTLAYLLFINFKSMALDKLRFKDKLDNRNDVELYKAKKEAQKVSWILLLIQIIVCIIVCIIFFTR